MSNSGYLFELVQDVSHILWSSAAGAATETWRTLSSSIQACHISGNWQVVCVAAAFWLGKHIVGMTA